MNASGDMRGRIPMGDWFQPSATKLAFILHEQEMRRCVGSDLRADAHDFHNAREIDLSYELRNDAHQPGRLRERWQATR